MVPLAVRCTDVVAKGCIDVVAEGYIDVVVEGYIDVVAEGWMLWPLCCSHRVFFFLGNNATATFSACAVPDVHVDPGDRRPAHCCHWLPQPLLPPQRVMRGSGLSHIICGRMVCWFGW